MHSILELLQTPGFVETSISLSTNVPPEVAPDFNGPGSSILRVVTSWVLGFVLGLGVLSFIACATLILSKGFGHQGVQQFGAKHIGSALVGVLILGSVYSIFAFTVGLDLGF